MEFSNPFQTAGGATLSPLLLLYNLQYLLPPQLIPQYRLQYPLHPQYQYRQQGDSDDSWRICSQAHKVL